MIRILKKIERKLCKSEQHKEELNNLEINDNLEIEESLIQEKSKQHNNGWIPTSERLPEPRCKTYGNKQQRVEVLVSLRCGLVKEMMYEFKTREFWEPGDENHIEHWKEDAIGSECEVVAWQPLPEPYKVSEV